ncbi:MAG: TetR/AcrR family transcriptional regulator [Mycobacterium sp.]|nr:TetR/AcrR family transcriptional regulator [Mycobacterium sp.]
MSEAAERGYRNFLSIDAIIAEARVVADVHGLDAVSMRTLADRLGCTPRALYRHVSDKEQVLELLVDRAMADVPVPAAEASWQDALIDFFTDMYQLLLESPAVARILAQQAVAGHQFRRHADNLANHLVRAGMSPDLAAEAVVALAQFTLGASLPGTGQPLHDVYRTRQAHLSRDGSPELTYIAAYFADDDAGGRFRTALRRLVNAYTEP